MVFQWFHHRRRRKVLAQPCPDEWLTILERNVAPYHKLSVDQQRRLCDIVQIFVAERNWEGCSGLAVTDEMRVTIAGFACLLLLGIEHDYFSHVLSVLVYPTDYRAPTRTNNSGVIMESEDGRHGEAWYRGPVILSWNQIEDDIANPWDGQNLVCHEFAHQLDMLDREVNGTPPLSSRALAQRWQRVMTAEFAQLAADARRGRSTLLDPYGATNEAEFFAVATECFFDAPWQLRDEHRELYDLLGEYYRQDPASWNAS
jgi:Mlc titration factor MtfA (ptsG expression regulator)